MSRYGMSATARQSPAHVPTGVGTLGRGRWLSVAIMAVITLVMAAVALSEKSVDVEATQSIDRRPMAVLDYAPKCE